MTFKKDIRKTLTTTSLVALLALSSVAPATFAEEQEQLPLAIETSLAEDVIPNEYVVAFKEGVSKHEMQATLQGYTVTNEQYQAGLATVKLTAAQFDRLKEMLVIDVIEPNAQVEVVATQYEQYAHEKTNVQQAWNSKLNGAGVKIAVIDSGIAAHDDLNIAGGKSLVKYTNSYDDDRGHGTHVAGIVGALNNDFGITGVASGAEIYSVKVLKNTGKGDLTDIIAGFDWAIEQNVDIINASLGTTYNSVLFEREIQEAEAKGIIVVAAAGNTGNEMLYPALYDSVVAVSATNDQNNLASFSSRGAMIDIAAPGQSIISTHLNNGYAKMSGTSMAAPYVSGMLALYKEAYPNKSAQQIIELAYSSALDLGAVGKDKMFGHGLVQFPQGPTVLNPTSIHPTVSADQQKILWDMFSLDNRYEVKMETVFDDGTYDQYRFTRTMINEQFDVTLLEPDKKYRLSITPYDLVAYDYTRTKYVYVSFENEQPVVSEIKFPIVQAPETPVEEPVEVPTEEPAPIEAGALKLNAAENEIYWAQFEQASYYQVQVEQKQADETYTKFGSHRQTSRVDYDLKDLVNGYTYRVSVLPRIERKYDAAKAIVAYIHVDENGQKTISYDGQTPVAPAPELPPVIDVPDEQPVTPELQVTLNGSKQLMWPEVDGAMRYRVELQQKNSAGEFVKYSYYRNVSVPQFDMKSLPQGYEYHLTIVPYINYKFDYAQAHRVYVDTATYTMK